MQQALYRKYRPRTFAEVIGQAPIRLALKNQIAMGRIGHAYLFAGPKGTGKTTLARIMARAVNCLNLQAGEPCNECENCVAADAGRLMDLIEIDAASNTGVDNVRELIANLYIAPAQGSYKIYIVDEAHMLSKGAFNALLKTLEEPPSHVIFILATTEAEKLLPTIVSRCQRFDFRPVGEAEIIERLRLVLESEGLTLNNEVLELIAAQSGGGVRDALSLLERVTALGADASVEALRQWFGWVAVADVVELADQVVAGQAREALLKVNDYVYGGVDMARLAVVWTQVLRWVLAVQLGNGSTLGLVDSSKKMIEGLAAKLSKPDVAWWLEQLMVLPREIKSSNLPMLPIELMIVRAAERLGKKEPAIVAHVELPSTPQPVQAKDEVANVALAPKSEEPVVVEQPAVAASQIVDNFEWAAYLEGVRRAKPTLAGTLNLANWEIKNNTLQIKFLRKFHCDVAMQADNRRVLTEAIEAGGWQMSLELVVDEQAKIAQSEVDLASVSQIFG